MRELLAVVFVFLVFTVVVFCAKCFDAKMESDTYNRLTGAHTTWWDAMWVELRIQESPK